MANRDHVAELLSLVRYAYASGFRDGNGRGRRDGNSELLYAESEASAIEYVRAREENERHPLAILCRGMKVCEIHPSHKMDSHCIACGLSTEDEHIEHECAQ